MPCKFIVFTFSQQITRIVFIHFFSHVERLFVVQCSNSRKDLSFQEFEGGSSSGGDVGHVTSTSGLFGSSNRVSSSNNCNSSLLLGQIGQDVDNSKGSLVELFEFKHSHRSVHNDGLAVSKGCLLFFGRVWSVVQSHPAIWDSIGCNDLGFGIWAELVGNNNVGRKDDFFSEFFGLGQNFLGGVNEVFFNQRSSNRQSLCLEEGENHTSSNDNLVALVEESVKDGDLGRNLGSSNDSSHWRFSSGDSSVKVFEFLGQKESRNRWLEELGYSLGRSVSTVGGTKGIVDEKVERSSELFNKFWFVLGFFLVEASVFEHNDISFLGVSDNLGNFFTDAVWGEGDFLSQKFSHAFSTWSQAELVFWSVLRTSQVGADRDDGTLALQVFNGWDRGSDTGIIGDGLSVEWNVNITTDQHLLSLEFFLAEVFDRLLGIQFEEGNRRGSTDNSESA
mmetsp:Transcript_22941/g.35087  ORF Transcript_22941/g.35087 Transcript_22941/m.35087 type:complete len:448 (-) Transcript_22941:110-1453(-)